MTVLDLDQLTRSVSSFMTEDAGDLAAVFSFNGGVRITRSINGKCFGAALWIQPGAPEVEREDLLRQVALSIDKTIRENRA